MRNLPPGKHDELLSEFCDLLDKYTLTYEDFLRELAKKLRDIARKQGNMTSSAPLISAASHLEKAGLDWYVSTK